MFILREYDFNYKCRILQKVLFILPWLSQTYCLFLLRSSYFSNEVYLYLLVITYIYKYICTHIYTHVYVYICICHMYRYMCVYIVIIGSFIYIYDCVSFSARPWYKRKFSEVITNSFAFPKIMFLCHYCKALWL